MPTVSVIIPMYNCSSLIERCLDSIINQDTDYSVEIIVIDDGSEDNSVEIVRMYGHPVKLLIQSNNGPASARNKGILAASGKYLAFLDADDYWLPHFLKETIHFLEGNPESIAVSVGQIHKIIGKPDIKAPSILETNPIEFSKPQILPDFFEFWAEHNHVCTGSVLMRTDVVKQTGGQRPELRITEDLEFWAYLATFGKWGFIPKVLFISDGGVVTRERGWVEKNRSRWASAPSINDWEQRFIKRISLPHSQGYLLSRGRIALDLAYCMILSSRNELAKETVVECINYLPKSRLSSVFKLVSRFELLWSLLCLCLRTRELTRKI